MKRLVLAALAGVALLATAMGQREGTPAGERAPDRYASDTLGFAVAYQGEVTTLAVNLATVLPGDSLAFTVVGEHLAEQYELRAAAGTVRPDGPNRWWWHGPPQKGHVRLMVHGTETGDSMLFNAFVLVPRTEIRNERLNGYRIGRYPETPLRGLDIYRRPGGFIEVTRANQDTPVSPHFRLGEFVAKQTGDFPKYVVLDERLLRKLEFLLRRVRDVGYPAESFYIMSGYRTPYYNRTLRNVRYSRHVYGAAADVFIDERPRDGVMDDLNSDGRIDLKDAQVLIDLVNDQLDDPAYRDFIGGLGRYAANARHGPFVHIDVRDRAARW